MPERGTDSRSVDQDHALVQNGSVQEDLDMGDVEMVLGVSRFVVQGE